MKKITIPAFDYKVLIIAVFLFIKLSDPSLFAQKTRFIEDLDRDNIDNNDDVSVERSFQNSSDFYFYG